MSRQTFTSRKNRKIRESCLVAVLSMVFTSVGLAQNVDVNPGAGSYPTLKDAFDAINAGTHTGAITVDVVGDTTETASAVLNASGTGSASYASVVISPSGGAARTISGSIAGHMIDLNGADNVTIDGLNASGNSLTIDNASATTATSTIRLANDAQDNVITNSTIKGASTSVTSGTIFVDTGATSGNTGNTISNNTITNSGANFPATGVFSSGTAGLPNSGTISGNNVQDYFSATLISTGINIGATGNNAWTINNNKLFQTATRVYTTGNTHSAIFVGGGAGYTINGNIIGFADANGNGLTTMIGNSVALAGFPSSYAVAGTSTLTGFRGINATFTAGGAVSNIQGNTFAGVALYTSANGSAIIAILVTSGNVNIGSTTGNTIGATSGGGGSSPASVYCATTGTGGAVIGVLAVSTGTSTIQNNTIGSIDSSGTSATVAGSFAGFQSQGTGGVWTLSNNTVGNSTVDNIRIGYLTTTGVSGGPLTNNGILTQTTTTTSGTMSGVLNTSTGATTNVNSNTVRNLATSVVHTSAVTAFIGVGNSGAVTSTVNVNNNMLGTNSERLLKCYFGDAVSQLVCAINFSTGATATTTVNLNNNIVQGFVTAATGQITGVTNQAPAGVAINIRDNQIGTTSQDALTYTAASGGAVVGFFNTNGTANALLTITGNDIRRINQTAAAGTNTHIYIQNQTYTGATNISNNTITNIAANTSGSVTFIGNSVSHAANSTHNVNNNSIVTGYAKTGGGGTILFYNAFGSSANTVSETNTGNNFSNMSFAGGTATNITGWRSADGTTPGAKKVVTNNTFDNITNSTSGTSQAMYVGFSDNTFAGNNVSGNTITNWTCAGTFNGIFSDGQNQNFFNNTISGVTSSGAGAVVGFNMTGATMQNIFRNRICNLSGTNAGSTVTGILMTAGTTYNVFNNLIGDLKAPNASGADVIRGISSTSATGSSTLNVSYNTINLNATSSGANFGTSGIFHTTSATATTATLNLRNNIIVNTSTANGTGLTVAYRRSSATLTNYGAVSNNNDFYAGTPGAANLIFFDGANSDQILAAYQARVAPSDSASFSVNPTFLSTTCGTANFLHIDASVPSPIESGGVNIAGITDDVDGDIRQGNAGYAGTGTAPDVGADEFNSVITCCKGDLDMDGDVTDADVPGFVYALIGIGSPPACPLGSADMDSSGTADGLDIQLFVDKMLSANHVCP